MLFKLLAALASSASLLCGGVSLILSFSLPLWAMLFLLLALAWGRTAFRVAEMLGSVWNDSTAGERG